MLSEKLDGLSALLWASDRGPRMFTRGDGKSGRDITALASKIIDGLVSVTSEMRRES